MLQDRSLPAAAVVEVVAVWTGDSRGIDLSRVVDLARRLERSSRRVSR